MQNKGEYLSHDQKYQVTCWRGIFFLDFSSSSMLLLLILSVVVLFTSSPDSWWLDFVVPFITTVSAGDGDDEASLLGDFDTTSSCVPLALKLSSWWLPFVAICSVSWLWPLVWWSTSTLEGDSQVSWTGVELILWSFSPEMDRSWKLVEGGEFGVASDSGLIGDSSPWWPLDPLVVGLGTGVFNWITLDWVPRMIRSLDLYQSSPSWSMTKSLVSWGIALIRSTT